MKKFFDKQPVWFAVVWIIVYVLALSSADSISEQLGTPKLITAAVGLVLTAYLASLGAYSLMSPLALELFLVLWTLPVLVMSDHAVRY